MSGTVTIVGQITSPETNRGARCQVGASAPVDCRPAGAMVAGLESGEALAAGAIVSWSSRSLTVSACPRSEDSVRGSSAGERAVQ